MEMVILTATVSYLNKQVIPIAGTVIIAGLLFRIVSRLMKAQQDPEDSIQKALKQSRSYILIMIIVTVFSSLVYVIDGYFK